MAFLDLMNIVFQSYLDSFVIVFIDDILVYSKNVGDHINHLRVVLQLHMENQLFPMNNKCEFWIRSVAFLCHIISSEGVEVDPRKIKRVKNWPRQLTTTDFRSFLGLEGYYRRFMDGFPSVASSLTTLHKRVRTLNGHMHFDRAFEC